MELNELMKSPPALLEELQNTFSVRPTLKIARGVIKAHSKSGIPISAYEKNSIIKEKQSLKQFIQTKGSGHQEYKDLYNKVKEDKIPILGIPERSLRLEGETKRRMELAEKYDWSLYSCQSLHTRAQPNNKKHDGIINWVRITLEEDADTHKKKNIETPLGWIRASDHLAFSKKDLRNYVFTDHYPNGIKEPGVQPTLPDFERVDLITPARYNGFRFAPLAIYVGYEKKDSTTPIFYAMTGGNALGESKVLYVSTDVDKEILMECGYKPTPFSNPENFYQFKVSFDKMNPIKITIDVFTREKLEEDQASHFSINLILEEMAVNGTDTEDIKKNRRIRAEKVAGFQNFIPPIHQFLSAFSRTLYLGKTVPASKVLPIVMEIAMLKRKRTKIASCHPVRKKRVEQLSKKIERLEKVRKTKP
jgi:DUF1365 family protein